MLNSNRIFVSILILSVLSVLITITPVKADISAPTPITPSQLPPTSPSTSSTPTSTTPSTVPIAPNTSYAVNQVKSGMVVSDSLTNETETQQQLQANPGYWRYGGDAPLVNAPYVFFRNTTGLYIGVQSPSNGTWAGYYAVTQDTNAMLFHSVISTPAHVIPSNNNWFENGMYVQNGTGNVSYIVCNAVTSAIGTQWVVSSATGNSFGATSFTNLWWSSMDQNQPLTRDCTIITNGHNYLEVYLDGTKVYENHSMNLNYINPMVAFLEPQSDYNGKILNGTYKNFYATTSENVTVTQNPTGASIVKIVKPTSQCYGTVLASAVVDSSGTASLSIGQYSMPLGAYIQVYDANGNEIASTSNPVNIFGGDVYSANQFSPSNTAGSTSNTAQCTGTVPTSLTANAISPSQINLSWTAPSNVSNLPSGYKIERSTDSGSTWSTITSNTGNTRTTYSDTGLQPSTTYTYRVSAVYLSSTSSPSNTASATTQCASCQLTVTAQNSTNASIQGLYTTLTNHTTGQVIASGFTPATFILSTGVQYDVTIYNYPPNVFNHWLDNNSTADPRQISITSNTQITAWFNNGQPPPVDPQPPTGLSASAVSSSQINLSWTAPAYNGGAAITGYKIERSTDSGSTWSTVVSNTGSTGTTYSDTGLAASTTYTYRVSAINSVGASSPSNTVSATTFATTSVASPPSPTGLAASAISPSQINLSWTAPSNVSNLLSGYKIERSTDSGSTWSTVVSNTGSTGTTYSDTGLAASTTYTYRVSAVYLSSTSSPSNTASATTQCASCQLTVTAQNSTNASIQGLYTTLTNHTTGQVIASGFTPVTLALNNGMQYDITVYNYPPNVFNHWLDNNSTADPRQISITSNTQITAWFTNGRPQPPTGLTTTGTSPSQINLSWTAPSNSGDSAIIGYMVERSANGGSTWSTVVSNTGSTGTTYSDTGLAASTTYTYRVSAINSFGASPPSNMSSATTQSPTASASPTGLAANAISTSQINLSWTAPSSNGGSAITGYMIERSTDGITFTTIVSNTTSTATTYSDTGLQPSITYTYRVSAINSVGTSQPSNASSATTQSPTVPQPPTGLTATTASSSQINLSWTAPAYNGGAAITGYKIERSTDSGSTWSTVVSNTGSTGTTYSDTGLAASTTYTYRVSAINSAGTGSPSNTASATSGAASSIALTGKFTASGNTNQIKLGNFNAGTGSNRVLVVGVAANKNYVSSVTFGTTHLTKAVSSFSNNDAEFWYLTNPSGTANIVVTMGGSTSAIVGAYSFSGVDQTTPISTSTTNHNAAASSPTVSITTKNQNSWVLDLPAIYGGVTLGSPTCTQQWDTNMPSAITGASSSKVTSSPGSATCSWTASGGGDLWDDIAIELKASG